MNPFILVYTILAVTIMYAHLTGNLVVELIGLGSVFLFLEENIKYNKDKKKEPLWLPGSTEREYFLFIPGRFRFHLGMFFAYVFGLISVISAIQNTFGILK